MGRYSEESLAKMRAAALKRPRCPNCGTFWAQGHNCRTKYKQPVPLDERLFSVVIVGEPDECWPTRTGLRYQERTRRLVELKIGRALLPGEQACHHCDNPPCCNPAHLFLCTQAENQKDMVRKGRSQTGERHWNARLTWDDVDAIRASAERHQVLADRYGVNAQHIRRIRNGLKWIRREST